MFPFVSFYTVHSFSCHSFLPSRRLHSFSESGISLTKHKSSSLLTLEATLKIGNNLKENGTLRYHASTDNLTIAVMVIYLFCIIYFMPVVLPSTPLWEPSWIGSTKCQSCYEKWLCNWHKMQEMCYCRNAGDYLMWQVELAVSQSIHVQVEAVRQSAEWDLSWQPWPLMAVMSCRGLRSGPHGHTGHQCTLVRCTQRCMEVNSWQNLLRKLKTHSSSCQTET